MVVIKDNNAAPIKAWVGMKTSGEPDPRPVTFVPDIEDTALQQLKNLARLPFIASNGVAVMPDVHAGIGATVGSVIATSKAIVPAAVGVDIGCGMCAVRTTLMADDLPDTLRPLRLAIEDAIPTGQSSFTQGHEAADIPDQDGLVKILENLAKNSSKKRDYTKLLSKAHAQVGTLGGGNHFIEVCLDTENRVWVMLHSGSRGIGNVIGSAFITEAKELMERWFIKMDDPNLSYLPENTEEFGRYMGAVSWAQDYAKENRRVMLALVLQAMKDVIQKPFEITDEAINCHHNYVQKENHFGENLWITRKGAIRAGKGELGIIPGSMGAKSYIVRGKGNRESYCSCSHGAGRVMSRTEAMRKFTVNDLKDQTYGVECRRDAGVVDEIPGAYKDIDQVMANQADLVEVVHTLKQVLCVKGA